MRVRAFRHLGEGKRTRYNLLLDDMTFNEITALENALLSVDPGRAVGPGDDEELFIKVVNCILDEIA